MRLFGNAFLPAIDAGYQPSLNDQAPGIDQEINQWYISYLFGISGYSQG